MNSKVQMGKSNSCVTNDKGNVFVSYCLLFFANDFCLRIIDLRLSCDMCVCVYIYVYVWCVCVCICVCMCIVYMTMYVSMYLCVYIHTHSTPLLINFSLWEFGRTTETQSVPALPVRLHSGHSSCLQFPFSFTDSLEFSSSLDSPHVGSEVRHPCFETFGCFCNFTDAAASHHCVSWVCWFI